MVFNHILLCHQRKKSQKDVQSNKQQKIQDFHRPPSQNIFFNETSISHWKVRAFREPALMLPNQHFNPDKFSSYLKIDLSGVRRVEVASCITVRFIHVSRKAAYEPGSILTICKSCSHMTNQRFNLNKLMIFGEYTVKD